MIYKYPFTLIRYIFFTLILIFGCKSIVNGSNLQGIVLNALDSTPIPHVWVEAGDQQIMTDANGQFELKRLSGVNSIKFTNVGFETIDYPYDGEVSSISVLLQPIHFSNADEVIILGKRKSAIELMADAVKDIDNNYLPTNVLLQSDYNLALYNNGGDSLLKANGTLDWYNAKNEILNNYLPYQKVQNNLINNLPKDFDFNSLIWDYNGAPFGALAQLLKEAYTSKPKKGKQQEEYVVSSILKNEIDDDDRVQYHLLFIGQDVSAYPGKDFKVLTDVLINKKDNAITRLRYVYIPNTLPMVNYFSAVLGTREILKNSEVKQILGDDRFKLLFFELNFSYDISHKKWYISHLLVKNNYLYQPYIAGTAQELNIQFEFSHFKVLNVKPIDFPTKASEFPADFLQP